MLIPMLTLMVGCGPSDDDTGLHTATDAPTDTETQPSTGTTATTADTGTVAQVPTFASSPTFRRSEEVGLTGWIEATTDLPTQLELSLQIDGMSWQLGPSELGTEHSVLVLGLRPDADLHVDVTATTESGGTVVGVVDLHTGALPNELKPPIVTLRDASRVEPGVTLMVNATYIVMVDADGGVCWYREDTLAKHEIAIWNGKLGLVAERDHIEEFELWGPSVLRLGTEKDLAPHVPVDTLALHHDVQLLPNGNFLSLSVERRWLDFPTSERNRNAPHVTQWVAGEVVVEVARDGTVVNQWPLLDLVDPARIGYDSVEHDYWEDFGPWHGDEVADWAHANALSYDPTTDTILVSLRHQDAVIGFRRATGELLWILANPVDWGAAYAGKVLDRGVPAQGDPFQWHQHGVSFTGPDTFALMDNANNGVPAYYPPREGQVSRALEVHVDTTTMTWDVVWEWGAHLGLYSRTLGDVDPLPQTGNRLVTFGNTEAEEGNGAIASMYEVTMSGDVVWEAHLPPPAGSWYRGARFTGVIPGPGR